MAIVLYKKGNTHTINGIECGLKKVEPKYFNGTPDEGWFLTPGEAYIEETEQAEEIKAEEQTEEAEEKNVLDVKKMSNPEIREAAKNAKIEGWDTKRIDTLKAEL